MAVRIREATENDIEAIRQVGEQAWPATYAFAGEDYIAHGLETWWSADAVRGSLARTLNLVAELDGRVVGMGNLDLRRTPHTIWKLYVLPGHQAAGIGSALLDGLLTRAPDGQRVALEYADGNDGAAAFYGRHGFREVRREASDRPGWPATVWVEHDTAGDSRHDRG